MSSKVHSKLKINSVRVERSIYEYNMNFEGDITSDPSVDFNIDFLINKENSSFGIVKLSCSVNTDKHFEKIPFYVDVAIMGYFEVEDKGDFEDYILNAVSILFPYIRAHINTVTAISGVQPFLIPSINIVELLQEKAKQDPMEETQE